MDCSVLRGLRGHGHLRSRYRLVVVRRPGVHLGGNRAPTISLNGVQENAETTRVLGQLIGRARADPERSGVVVMRTFQREPTS